MGDKKKDEKVEEKKKKEDKKKQDQKDKDDKKNKKDQDKKDKEQNKEDKKKDNDKKKDDNKNKKQQKDKKDDKRSAAVQKKEEKSFDKTMDFECEGEPKTWPWFENKGHWECEVGNKGKVCAYVCNYNVSKQSIVFCDNGEWMDSRFAHDKCL